MVSEVQRNSAAVPAVPPPIVGGRHLITVQPPGLPEATVRPERPAAEETDADTAIPGLDVRNATPRQISDVSLDLYAAGMLTYEDYTALAFQPELHPDYNRTVGALTGERAQPDRRRDFVKYWSDRLQFELRYNAQDSAQVRQTGRIHDLMKGLSRRTRLDV
jgi:hypothetical protein